MFYCFLWMFKVQLLFLFFQGGRRSDGRISEGVRFIDSKCGLFFRVYGSVFFIRGEIQVYVFLDFEYYFFKLDFVCTAYRLGDIYNIPYFII